MKQIALIFTLFTCSIGITLSQDIIKTASDKIAKSIDKKLRSVKEIPDDSKVAVCMFYGQDNVSDTIKSMLGIKLSSEIHHSLVQLWNKKEYKAFFPESTNEAILYEAMTPWYTPPETAEERSGFWKKVLDEQRPDFFLIGKYRLTANTFEIENVFLRYNKYNPEKRVNKDYAVDDITVDITVPQKSELEKQNMALNYFSDLYKQLSEYEGNANIVSFSIIKYPANTIVTQEAPFYIGESYRVALNLSENAYIYAFFYDPQDKKYPYFNMIYPIDDKADNLLQKGENTIPLATAIEMTPPEGRAYIKIIASKMKIPVEFTKFYDAEGSMYVFFKEENCRKFLNKLNELPKNNVDAKAIIKEVKKK